MSLIDESMNPSAQQRQLDRLVDGELSEADRRVLLLKLEHEPEGWRNCALAFLEAQCWQAELGQISRGQGEVSDISTSAAIRDQSDCQVAALSRSQLDRSPHWRRWRQYAATL